jgi:DNA repair photolyase
VSKPHLECIKKICYELVQYKPQIQFRFTIGSANSEVLKFWEPNAPSFEERVDCLKYANNEGFSTSVSCEPMLDENIGDVVDIVSPYVTDTIWIGKANQLFSRLNINGITDANSWNEAYKLDKWQSKRTNINVLKLKYANNPMIKFKHGT